MTLQTFIKEREERFDEQFNKGVDFSDFELSPKERKILENGDVFRDRG